MALDLVGYALNNQKYIVTKLLGKGGMGAVYLATNTAGQKVAIKQMIGTKNKTLIKRFFAEARVLASLNHINIVKVIDMFEETNDHFLVMEVIQGQDLSEIIKERKMPPKEILDIAIQCAEAMAHFHKKGIIHRDIKPSNIMITKDGIAKITDFGLVKDSAKKVIQTVVTMGDAFLGTVSYMDPVLFGETKKTKEVLKMADIYALGASLYEIIEGKKLVEGDNALIIIAKAGNNESAQCTLTGRWKTLADIVNKMTIKDHNLRYQNIDDVVRDLKRFQRQLEAGRTARNTQRTSPKQKPSVFFPIASLFGIFVVFAFIFLLPWGQKTLKHSPQENKNGSKEKEKFIEDINRKKSALEEKLRKEQEKKEQEQKAIEEKRTKIENLKALLDNHNNSVSFRNSVRALIQHGEFDYVRSTIDTKLSPHWIEESKHYDENTPLILLEMSAELYRWTKEWEDARKNLHTAITIIAKQLKPIQEEVMKLIGEIRKHDSKVASAVAQYSVSKILQNKGGEFDVDSEEFKSLLQQIRDCTPPGSKLPKKVKSFHARIASLYLQRALFLVSRSDCHLELALEARNKVIANIDTARQKEVFRHHREKALEDINQALSLFQKEQWKQKKKEIVSVQKP